ncbi:doubled motif LPXTG anchor domain-containing protein [Clostridium sp. AM58-1XD]|uniref:doubled motif LPXTG anchor domain-containing protein n=1 Tax=Clostridium sp. AM58-1XD TaxID=2292307 RepID=UPI0015F530F4|nr:doubled motif LPXTG anchor domain-containing protein [Clostridium sp. AM58-1XD]
MESGIYTLTTIDENGVPLASFPFQIDDGGVPLGLPKTGDTGNLPYALLTAIMAGALIGAMALRRKKETEEE